MNHDHVQTTHPLIEAHRSLMGAIEALQREVPHGSLANLQKTLSLVRGQILEHFRLEEQGGYMKQALERSPFRERDVEKLLKEHRTLGAAIDSILEELRRATDVAPIRQRIEHWIVQVRGHERQENILVEEVFDRDMGTKD